MFFIKPDAKWHSWTNVQDKETNKGPVSHYVCRILISFTHETDSLEETNFLWENILRVSGLSEIRLPGWLFGPYTLQQAAFELVFYEVSPYKELETKMLSNFISDLAC